jgi:hypothetical protein
MLQRTRVAALSVALIFGIGAAGCGSSEKKTVPHEGVDAGGPPPGNDSGPPPGNDMAGPPPGNDAAPAPDVITPPPPPPPPEHDLELKLSEFTLDGHAEIINCQYFPATGQKRWVKKFTVDMSPGSHHLVVFRVNETPGAATPDTNLHECSQLEVPTGLTGMLPGAQTPHAEMALPDGVAMLLDANEGVYLQSHYINAGATPITAKVSWAIDTMPEAEVVNKAGIMFYGNYSLNIPAHSTIDQSQTCKIPFDMKLIGATGHMHKHATKFVATIDNNMIYETESWDGPPQKQFTPAMDLTANQALTWTCSYFNDTDNPLFFGNSASTNEMCIFVGIYYPTADSETLFNCLQ